MGRPGPHPEPPDDLAQRRLPLLRAERSWLRIHRLIHAPLFFGRSGNNRFDAPAREYGVLYAASDEHCAFIETFGHATGVRFITATNVRAYGLARVEISRPLSLVDLTGAGLAHLGADERLCAGDYAVAQRWSLALWQHPARPDGLYYRSRHDPSRLCVALYDHVEGVLATTHLGGLADPARADRLADLLATYRFGLIDNTAD